MIKFIYSFIYAWLNHLDCAFSLLHDCTRHAYIDFLFAKIESLYADVEELPF